MHTHFSPSLSYARLDTLSLPPSPTADSPDSPLPDSPLPDSPTLSPDRSLDLSPCAGPRRPLPPVPPLRAAPAPADHAKTPTVMLVARCEARFRSRSMVTLPTLHEDEEYVSFLDLT